MAYRMSPRDGPSNNVKCHSGLTNLLDGHVLLGNVPRFESVRCIPSSRNTPRHPVIRPQDLYGNHFSLDANSTYLLVNFPHPYICTNDDFITFKVLSEVRKILLKYGLHFYFKGSDSCLLSAQSTPSWIIYPEAQNTTFCYQYLLVYNSFKNSNFFSIVLTFVSM